MMIVVTKVEVIIIVTLTKIKVKEQDIYAAQVMRGSSSRTKQVRFKLLTSKKQTKLL